MEEDLQPVTRIGARILPGQHELFDEALQRMAASGRPGVPGTTARYILRDEHDPDSIHLILIWRNALMPVEEDRAIFINALKKEFEGLVAWDEV